MNDGTIKSSFRLGHVPAIDGLRAFSIIFVMGYHGIGPITGSFAKAGGWIGVDAFFVISGFLITSLLLKELDESGRINFPNFWRRRFFRLFPAFIVYLVARVVLNPRHIESEHNWRAAGVALLSLSDFDLAFEWGNVRYTGFEPTWSLAVEERFYLLWPFLLAALSFRSIHFCVLAILASQAWKAFLVLQNVPWIRLSAGFDAHIDSLLFGALVAHLLMHHQKFQDWVTTRGNPFVLVLALLSLAMVLLIGNPSSCTTAGRFLIWIVQVPLFAGCFALLIACIAVKQDLWVAKFLSFKALRWIGVISYSLYLWDGFYFFQIHQFCMSNGYSPVVAEALKFLLALSFASASYYLIEKRFLSFRERYRFRRGLEGTEQPITVPDQGARSSVLTKV